MDTCHDELHTHYYGVDGTLPQVRSVREVLPHDPIARADRLHAIHEDRYEDMLRTAAGRAP